MQLAVSAPGSRTIARTIVGGRKQPAGIVFAANLNDPADVGHPAPFRVSALLLPNNEESNKDADQQRYQKELTHEDRLMLIWDRTLRGGSSGHKQDTGGKWQAIEHFWDLLPIDKQCPKQSDAGLCPHVNSKNQRPEKKTTDPRLRENCGELSLGSSSPDRLGGLHHLYGLRQLIAPTPKPAPDFLELFCVSTANSLLAKDKSDLGHMHCHL